MIDDDKLFGLGRVPCVPRWNVVFTTWWWLMSGFKTFHPIKVYLPVLDYVIPLMAIGVLYTLLVPLVLESELCSVLMANSPWPPVCICLTKSEISLR